MAELITARAPEGRAHLVGLSWGGRIAHTLLDDDPDRIDRAVIDGASVHSSWLGNLVRLGIIVITPVLRTAPLVALVGDMVGMDEEARAALRVSSPRAIRRAYLEGCKTLPARTEIAAPCPTLLVAGEKESTVRRSNAALAALMPHALARYVPGLAHAWLLKNPELHVRMVEAWLADEELPPELVAEPSATERLLRHVRPLAKRDV
jgi:pimeloyl-ACP methyl ester carboxylesterase